MPIVSLAWMATVALAASTASTSDAHVVEIVGVDYAFQVPDRVDAGRTTFRFVNKGKKSHELNVLLLKPGATLEQYYAARRAGTSVLDLIESPVGVLFTEPGLTGPADLTADLIGGRDYVLVCNHRDERGGPRHFAMGMFSVIHVRPGTATSPERQAADTIVATEHKFSFPAALSAGHHSIAFVNAGTKQHELKLFLLSPGVTLREFIDGRRKGDVVRTLADRAVGVLFAPGGSSPLGVFELDLLPGREYAFVCDFTDGAADQPHVSLGMFGSFRVVAK